MKVKRGSLNASQINALVPVYLRESLSRGQVRELASAIIDTGARASAPSQDELVVSGGPARTFPIGNMPIAVRSFYESSDLPLNVLDAMRRDSQVALGLAIVKMPVTQLGYTINCESPTIKNFINENIQNVWQNLLRDSLKSIDFGFSASELVWKSATVTIDPGKNLRKTREKKMIVLEKTKSIHPETCRIRVDNKGNFVGLNQNISGEIIRIPENKSFLITYDEEFGNYFGRSRMVSAYEPWYYKQITTQFLLRFTERFALPPYKVFYPKGITRFPNGDQKSNADIAMTIAEGISSYGNSAVPSDRDDKGNLKWDIENLDQQRLGVKPSDLVGFWDAMILRGLLIPDSGTTSGMDEETASKVFLSTIAAIVKQIEDKINKKIIWPLVQWNFPPEQRSSCRINIDDIDFMKRSEMRKLLSKIFDISAAYIKNFGALPFNKFPDIAKILEVLDIPAVDAKAYPLERASNNSKAQNLMRGKPGADSKDEGGINEANNARTGRGGNPRDDIKQDTQA